jgi:hypothetical protein
MTLLDIIVYVLLAINVYLLFRALLVYYCRTKALYDSRYSISEILVRLDRLPDYLTMLVFQPLRFNWDDYLEGKVTK